MLHITDDGVETLESIYWLVNIEDDPKTLRRMLTGATTATGPDGLRLVGPESLQHCRQLSRVPILMSQLHVGDV